MSTAKYHAIPTVVDGIRFHSKREAKRYGELKLLERAKVIRDLTLQPSFPLYAVNSSTGEVSKVGEYRADFRYVEDDKVIVEDVKGMAGLPMYRWKIKHLRAQEGIVVREHR